MATHIVKIITAAGFVAVPVLPVLVGLDWYFKSKDGRSHRAIFIAVAGTESAIFYSYLVWNPPSPSLILTPIGWYLGLSVLAVAIYFGLYAAYHGQAVRWWILPVALVSYTGLYSALAIFCAAVLVGNDYLILGGHVFADSGNSRSLPGATLLLKAKNRSLILQSETDSRGRFLFCLPWNDYKDRPDEDKAAWLVAQALGYLEQTRKLDGHPKKDIAFSLQKRSVPNQ
jgi:hypothetical protein